MLFFVCNLIYPQIAGATVYAPGTTLEPDCPPTESLSTCGVSAPATAGANSNITSLTGLTTALSAGQGGTGLSSYTIGDLLYASSISAISKLAIGTTGQVLQVSGGVPLWVTSSGTGDALVANPLSQFATTTSAQLAGVISDETGSGLLVLATSPTLITPALGTPSALVGTNITGTASGLTAGTVTTNANLTGAITSVGNATSLGSFNLTALNTALSDADVATGGGTATGTNTGDQTTISGNAGTATALQTVRTIGGVSFDGTANITIATATGGLTVSGGNLALGANALTGTTGIIDYTNFDVDTSGNITVAAAEGLDTNAAGALEIGKANATSVDLCSSTVCDTINIGNLATTDADTINIGDVLDTIAITGSSSSTMSGFGLADCDGSYDKLNWDITTSKFSCAKEGSQVKSITDTTSESVTTTDSVILDNASFPNYLAITPSSSSNEILVMYSVDVDGGDSNNSVVSFTVHRTTNGTAPTCASTLVGSAQTADITNAFERRSTSASVLDSPGVATEVRYTICGDLTIDGGTDPASPRISLTVMEVDQGADLAEIYSTNDATLSSGELVSIDPSLSYGVKRSDKAYDKNVIGVVSTRPALVIGHTEEGAQGGVPVALSGRVPVKVNTENGAIAVGDLLTSAGTPGVAMKATDGGIVIGQALSSFDSESDTDRIFVFIKNTYSPGEFSLEGQQVLLGDISPKVNADGTDNGLATLVATIQSETARDPIAIITEKIINGKQFLTDFVSARITAIRGYFDEVYANVFNAKEKICIGQTCLTENVLKTLLDKNNIQSATEPTPISPLPVTSESVLPETPSSEPDLISTSESTEDLAPTETPILNETILSTETSTSEPTSPPPVEQSAGPAPVEPQ